MYQRPPNRSRSRSRQGLALDVSLTLWSDALGTAGEQPSEEWKGRWISIRGLVQPPSPKQKHPAASIQVTNLAQIVRLTEQEAKYRLAGPGPTAPASRASAASNAQRLAAMRAASPTSIPAPAPAPIAPVARQPYQPSARPPPAPPPSQNEQVLAKMRQAAAAPPSVQAGSAGPSATPSPSMVRQHAQVPPPPPANPRVPGWVWIGMVLVAIFLLRLQFG
jgi:hypothetical protein